MHYYW